MIPYGVHRVAGVDWLLQEGKPVNAIGLTEDPPIRAIKYSKHSSPHYFELNVKMNSALMDQVQLLRRDPCARFYLPGLAPMEDRIRFVEGDNRIVAKELEKLWSPRGDTRVIAYTSSGIPHSRVRMLTQQSNLVPMTFMGINYQHQHFLTLLSQIEVQHYVMLFGDRTAVIPWWTAKRTEDFEITWEQLRAMDLPAVGNALVRAHMRGEVV